MKSDVRSLPFSLEREVTIRAPRTTVFRYFTDNERFARWWGAGSTVEGRVGGALRIVYPDGTKALGEMLEILPHERVVFTYGYEGQGKQIAPGGSRVTVTFSDHADGTLVRMKHEVADAHTRDHHIGGWRYHLAVFANVVADEVHAGLPALADRWFGIWNEADAGARRAALDQIAAADAVFQDAHGSVRGRDDIAAHVTASRMFLPGITTERAGDTRQCQGTALVDWIAKNPAGQVIARGTNVFELTADSRLARIVGLWEKK